MTRSRMITRRGLDPHTVRGSSLEGDPGSVTLTHTLLDLIVDGHNDVDAAEGLGLLTAAEVERTSAADPDAARVLTYPAHRLDGATQA